MKQKISLLIFFSLISFWVNAQTLAQEKSGKVGLVLSGGGAKGLAHIGVLKVIDSLGIKIDYVAGTSMGAVVGSLYASGYSGKELDSIFNAIDFNHIINDDLPRETKAFSERKNSEKYAITLPFDNYKLKLPSAFSRGQNTYNLLSRLTLHINGVRWFKHLPIPFFCVATDVETGEAVVLDKGNLAEAVMASAALPSLFQPVIINNQTLIDGGVVNNYPISKLKAKGMDIIIGVDVQDGLLSKEELTSAPDVLMQINNFRTINDMKLKSKETDIYIKPDIKDFTLVSFGEGNSIIKKGVEAAHKKINSLKDLAGNQQTPFGNRNFSKINDSIKINNIYINGNKRYTRAYILGKLKLKNKEKLSYNNLIRGVNSLIATDNFDAFFYRLKPNRNGHYDLHANIKETKITTFLKLGVHYDNLYKSAVLVNLTKKRFLFNNDQASLDFILGDNLRYNFDYLVDKGFYWSIGLSSRFNNFNKNISGELLLEDREINATGLNKIDVELQDQTNQFYLQTLFRKDFVLKLGLEHKRLEVKSETITINEERDEFVFENTDYFSFFANLKLDTYDSKYFPKKGVYFNGDLHNYMFASKFNKDFDNFSIIKANAGYAFGITDKFSINLQADAGLKIGSKSTQTLDFSLGGYGNNLINNFMPFIGYDFLSITGNSFLKAYAKADFEIFKKNHIFLEANWANVENDLFETPNWISLPDYRGYGLGYAVETFVGPIEIKYSFSPEAKQDILFFNIGFWF